MGMLPVKLSKEQREAIVARVQAYFETERSESIGNLAADQLLEFMMRELGPYLYNKGLDDARTLLNRKAAETDDELYALELPVQRR